MGSVSSCASRGVSLETSSQVKLNPQPQALIPKPQALNLTACPWKYSLWSFSFSTIFKPTKNCEAASIFSRFILTLNLVSTSRAAQPSPPPLRHELLLFLPRLKILRLRMPNPAPVCLLWLAYAHESDQQRVYINRSQTLEKTLRSTTRMARRLSLP